MIWETTTAIAAGAAGFMYYATAVPSSQVFGPAVVRGEPGSGRVALTFDDGPSETTPAVLDALAKHGARATFFLCGANVARLPDIARRIDWEGHELGNHTFSHPRLCFRSPAQIGEEIEETQRAVVRAVGHAPALFRPPYGLRWVGLYPALRLHRLPLINWSVCAYDWKRPAAAIEADLRAKVSDGDIVLLHDGDRTEPGDRRAATARAVASVLPWLAGRGLRCVTVSELLDWQWSLDAATSAK